MGQEHANSRSENSRSRNRSKSKDMIKNMNMLRMLTIPRSRLSPILASPPFSAWSSRSPNKSLVWEQKLSEMALVVSIPGVGHYGLP